MKDTPDTPLGLLLFDAARLMRRRLEQEARNMPMTAAQLRVVGRLTRNEGISQAALANLLDLEPMTLCRHIDRMEAAGLVERRQDPSDRRAKQIFSTAKSRALIEPMRERAAVVYEQALAGLSRESREAVTRGLERMIENLAASDVGRASARTTEQETA